MKNLFSNTIVFMAIVLFFSSCEKDLYDQNIQNTSRNLTLKRVSLKNSVSKTNSKLMKALHVLNNEILSPSSKMVHDSIYDFYFDDENGIYIEDANKNSYTFPVFRTSAMDEKVENLLFNLNDKGEYDVFLVKYDLTKEELEAISQSELAEVPKEYMGLVIDGRVTLELVCIEIQSYQLVAEDSWGTIAPNYHYEWVTIATSCSWQFGGGTDGINNGVGGNPNPNYGPGPHGGGGSTGNGGSIGEILTSPISLSAQQIALNNFLSSLNLLQLAWYNGQTTEIKNIINEQVYQGAITNNSSNDVMQIFNSMMNNDGYSGDGFMGDSDDENNDYSGPKEHIPSTIVLDDGSSVSVTFGTTSSDGQSADDQVASSLVESIRQALNQANSNLGPTRKITSIYIMATTNGSHSPNSNHTKGTAVDISRINGVKIANLGPNDQVQALQNGFDGYNGIRENFGPHFKHKTYPDGSVNLNFPVGGHGDHIHVSVQNN